MTSIVSSGFAVSINIPPWIRAKYLPRYLYPVIRVIFHTSFIQISLAVLYQAKEDIGQ
jgi:hypothetical protein